MTPYICPNCRRVLKQQRGSKHLICEKCSEELPSYYTVEYIEGYWRGYFKAKEELNFK